MEWEAECTDELEDWWEDLTEPSQLEIRAHFPEGDVLINQFEELEEKQQPAA